MRARRHGAFAHAAGDLCALGLAVVPVDGKVPLVEWERWRRPPGRKAVAHFTDKFPCASVGVLTGLSGVTVVDVDDPALVERMVRRFGATPLVIRTPSGGSHLWYRANGERCANLRDREGMAVDIKAAGGMVLVPPSPGYRFASGGWADLPRLPTIAPGSLPAVEGCESVTLKGANSSRLGQEGYKSGPPNLRAVGVGRRNTTLFRLLLRKVRACDTESDLLDVAETIVAQHFELHPESPFPPAEIAKTVRSVWRYEQQGRNWVGQEARAMTTAAELAILQRNPDALLMRLVLLCAHGADPDSFALSPKALAEAELIDGWNYPRRYRHARDWLLEHGFLAQLHVGGRGARDPHRYRLASPVKTNQGRAPQSPDSGAGGVPVILGAAASPLQRSRLRRGQPPLRARVRDWLAARERATRVEVMRAHGVGAGEAQRALARLCADGHAERVGLGLYRATGVGSRRASA